MYAGLPMIFAVAPYELLWFSNAFSPVVRIASVFTMLLATNAQRSVFS